METMDRRKVEYGDYLLMTCDEEDKRCMPHEVVRNMSVTFMEYFEYMLDNGFEEIEEHLLTSLQLKKWCNYSDDDIIDSILAKTDMERGKKKKQKDYYIANGKCAIDILKLIFTQDLYEKLKLAPTVVKNNYFHILKYIMIDVDQLINEYENNLNNSNKYYSNPHRPIHTMALHNVLRQSAYGRASFHSFADIEIDASIAVIRQMIELRMRRAFAALALIDANGNIYPLDLSSVFDILKKYDDIVYPGKLTSIERIYKWSNLYIHSGTGDYAWITYFLERYLRPFSFGEMKSDGSWSYANGISLSKETFEKIEQDIAALNSSFKVVKCKPECEIK